MLQYERQQHIIDILKKKHSISIKALAKTIYASEASVRRDIQKLESMGIIERIYGGVVLSEYKNEVVPVNLRDSANSESKEMIAFNASKLISEGDTVMLDSSSTARRICRYLKGKKNIKIITNNMRVCSEASDVSVFLTGGMFSKTRECFVGSFAENFIASVHADILFFSSTGISKTGEITDISEDEINLRRLMIKQAKKRIYSGADKHNAENISKNISVNTQCYGRADKASEYTASSHYEHCASVYFSP